MSKQYTTALQLQKAIDDNLIDIQKVQVEVKDNRVKSDITPDQFKEDLDFYVESGIFSDSIDFRYEMIGQYITIYAGFMSNFCNVCITVNGAVKDSSKDDLDAEIRKEED